MNMKRMYACLHARVVRTCVRACVRVCHWITVCVPALHKITSATRHREHFRRVECADMFYICSALHLMYKGVLY